MTSDQLIFNINIPVVWLKKMIRWIIVLNILFLIGTWAHDSRLFFQDSYSLGLMLKQFNLGTENVAAAWYSSMLLFLIAMMACVCYWADSQRTDKQGNRIMNIGWLFIALAFTVLSFDEMGSFHESIGESGLFKKLGAGKMSGWRVFYVAGGLVAAFMIAFSVAKFKGNKKVLLFSVTGFLLYVSIPFQEKFEHSSWHNSPDTAHWRRPVFFLLVEEGSELLASFCFFCSFTIYAIGATAKNSIRAGEKRLEFTLTPNKHFLICLIGFLIAMGGAMQVIYLKAWHFKIDDYGMPQNWFPSVVSFTTFGISSYQFFKCRHERQKQNARIYLSIALAGLFTSLYFGCNVYNYRVGIFTKFPFPLLLLTSIAAIAALVKLPGIWTKVAIAVWPMFMVLSVFTKTFFSPPFFGFIAFSSLLIAFYFDVKYRSRLN